MFQFAVESCKVERSTIVDTRRRKRSNGRKSDKNRHDSSRARIKHDADCGKMIDSGERRSVDLVKSVKLVIRRGFAHAFARVRFPLLYPASIVVDILPGPPSFLFLSALFRDRSSPPRSLILCWHEFDRRSSL